MAENNCSTCNQSFNSDRELQEHQQRSTPETRGAESVPRFRNPVPAIKLSAGKR
jgi:hypothetical protein